MTARRRDDAPISAQSLQSRINDQAAGHSGLARRLQLLVADAAIAGVVILALDARAVIRKNADQLVVFS